MPNLVGEEAITNNTTPVTLVTAPGTGIRRVVVIARLNNRDTAPIDAIIQHANGVTDRVLASDATLAVGGTVIARTIVLDSTSESVEIVLGASVTTNQLHGTAVYYDEAL